MIPAAAITQWSNIAPWTNPHYVEQDLIICRVLISIFSDEFLSSRLAFRGGTAMHKLFLTPQQRYSEDIDLVQISAEPIGAVLDRLKEVLNFLGIPKTKQKLSNNVLQYHYNTETLPITRMSLKIEINCKEHLCVKGWDMHPFTINNAWFSGDCHIRTYHLDELIGTKTRALYQRKKGRDMFDLYHALNSGKLNVINMLDCYREYMMFSNGEVPSAAVYLENLTSKMKEPVFRDDIGPMLRPGTDYNSERAFEVVKNEIIRFM
jgi:predicted nucleotidyltransferase component of viral defense system